MQTQMTTADATIDALLAHGIDTLYALPGVHNDQLFDAIVRSNGRMRALHPRHEQTSGYMALGAALATGRAQAFRRRARTWHPQRGIGIAHRLRDRRAGDRDCRPDPLRRYGARLGPFT